MGEKGRVFPLDHKVNGLPSESIVKDICTAPAQPLECCRLTHISNFRQRGQAR